MIKLLTGNEAIAQGALEAGVDVVTGYPGTPSTEVMLNLMAKRKELGIHMEWSVNEKVAFEIAAGAAWVGKRALVTMKMSGLNVAADSISAIAYSGCTGGLVIFVADDPGTSAGMVEQDSRYYAKSMIIPTLDLASQQECLDYMKIAFEISENIKGPVMLRSTTDIAHVASLVDINGQTERDTKKREAHFERNIPKYTKAASAWCMAQHQDALNRLTHALETIESKNYNKKYRINEIHFEPESKYGVIYGGAVQGNFLEVLNRYNIKISRLKIGMVHPLPESLIKEFLENKNIERILILEELDPIIESEIYRIAFLLNKKVEILGKLNNTLPYTGSYSFVLIKKALEILLESEFNGQNKDKEKLQPVLEEAQDLIVARPTSFCSGCPHRGTYYALNTAIKNLKYKKDDIIVHGDIGCTILGMNKPFESCWTEVAMGASIGMAQGFKWGGIEKPVIAAIGDSTFFHAGIPPLINAVHQNANVCIIILDNWWTAMTGFEENPGTIYLKDTDTRRVNLVNICQGCGVEKIDIIDPYEPKKAIKVLEEAIKYPGVSVVVSRQECALQAHRRKVNLPKYRVDIEKCTGCQICLNQLACPEMVFHPKTEDHKAYMEISVDCFGCGLCQYTCPFGAIEVIEDGK
ncbi:MAG: thiamine pyrophosphate-dependent enzyme [Atribacterota bacterium]|nr:thiamine pyrophosphate-dependent enzyme [Atribacterota bacterium]